MSTICLFVNQKREYIRHRKLKSESLASNLREVQVSATVEKPKHLK